MPDQISMQLAVPPGMTFAIDNEARTISGIAMPTNAVGTFDGEEYQFDVGGIEFRARTPVLLGHDFARAVGLVTMHGTEADGLRVKMSIARTPSGDEALTLAQAGILGLSIGCFIKNADVVVRDKVNRVSKAETYELSLTPVPVYAGTRIDTVNMSLSEGSATMPDTPPVGTVPTPTPTVAPPAVPVPPAAGGVAPLTQEQITAAVVAAIAAQQAPVVPIGVPGPTVVPVAQTHVTEEPLYRLEGSVRGKFSLVSDIVQAEQGYDSAAAERLQKFMKEKFEGAVTTTTAPELNPLKTRADLLVGIERYAKRPLAAAISSGTINNADPFRWPILENEDPNLQDHVEGVEPALGGTYEAGEASITPRGVSTKIKLSRESLMSDSTPSLDAWVWQSIMYGLAQKYEARIATMLDEVAVTGTGAGRTASIAGEDATVTDALNAVVISNQFRENGSYDSLVLNEAAYTAFASARDGDARPLVVFGPAVNADGTRSANFGNIYVSGLVGVPAYALNSYSYLLRGSEIVQWTSTPIKFTLDQVEISNVYLGVLSLEAHTVMRNSAVIRLTR